MDQFQFIDKSYFIAGIANKKSVAYFCAKKIIEFGGKVILSAQNEKNLAAIQKLFPESPSFILDVENENDIKSLSLNITKHTKKINGFLHSMAFANFSDGPKPFHETSLNDYMQACHISSFSLIQIANELKSIMDKEASVVTVSISNTKATSYGYLGPIKAMLETTVCYLSKSFSEFSNIRFNSVGAGPLKTSASAGIPNYIENYLYSEQLTMRKEALRTEEVANSILFLLSPLSSGINATNQIVDLGMNSNYFDQDIVKGFAKSL
jgi:enoyl-[acyl-carrier protein] reductase I